MSDSRYYSRDFITEAVELYKSFPCLWKINSEDFKNRSKREKAIAELVKKFNEVDPNVDKQFVFKKFASWRNTWKKEYKKVKNSLNSGAGIEDIYTPSLWYFELFSFIADQEVPRYSASTLGDEDGISGTGEDDEDKEDFSEENMVEAPSTPQSLYDEGYTINSHNDTYVSSNRKRTACSKDQSQTKKLPRSETDPDDLLNIIRSKIENPETSDRFDHLAKNWADKLRTLDPSQRIFAEKLVSDIFYEAELQTLSRHSKVTVGGSQHYPQYSDHHNIYPSLGPMDSSQPFTVSFTPGLFSGQCYHSKRPEHSMQTDSTGDNHMSETDEGLITGLKN